MKMKMNLGEGGIMGFLSRHCEKIVLGVIALVVLWMALPSSTYSPLDESAKGPEALTRKVDSAQAKLRTESWPVIKEQRFPKSDNLDERANVSTVKVDYTAYLANVPLMKPGGVPVELRRDPDLYPPTDMKVAVSYGAIAVAEPDARDARGLLIAGGGDRAARAIPGPIERKLQEQGVLVAAAGAKAKPSYVVSVTGLIPIKKQRAAYLAALENSAMYSPDRDQPRYGAGEEREDGMVYYVVARAEVPIGANVEELNQDELKFVLIADSRRSVRQQREWAPVGDVELVNPLYTNPNFTSKVPPLMLRPREPLALHPKVPRAGADELAMADEPAENTGEDEPDDGVGSGIGPEIGPGVGPRPPRDGARPVPPPPRGRPIPPPRGRGEFGGEFGGGANEVRTDAEYWLFRYYDTSAVPGKSYVYKVKLYLEDPNNPQPPAEKLPNRVLHKTVIDRLRSVPQHEWWRETDFSEVSPVAHIPDTKRILAGPIDKEKPGDVVPVPGTSIEIRRVEKSVEMMVVDFDKRDALDVVGKQKALRGTVLNFTANGEAIDPFAPGLVEVEGHDFRTGTMLLDIRGGDPFERKGSLTEPGEFLMVDDNGKLIVHSELDDAEAYNLHNFPAETVDAPPNGAAPAPPGGGERPRGGGEVDIFGG